MPLCQVWGDLGSERVDEQYPLKNVCADCFDASKGDEDSQIVAVVGELDEDYGKDCYICDEPLFGGA